MIFQTDKGMHIVVSTMADGRLNTSLERKIQLVTIRGVSLSNYRDDWMVRMLCSQDVTIWLNHSGLIGHQCYCLRGR